MLYPKKVTKLPDLTVTVPTLMIMALFTIFFSVLNEDRILKLLFCMEQVVERIKTCYDQIEESNDYIASGKWLKASEGFEKASILIRYNRPQLHTVPL